MEYDKTARSKHPIIHLQQIGNHHWLIYYLIINPTSLTFAVDTDSENHTEKRLIIISVSFVLAEFDWILSLKAKYALSGVNPSMMKMSYHSCLFL